MAVFAARISRFIIWTMERVDLVAQEDVLLQEGGEEHAIGGDEELEGLVGTGIFAVRRPVHGHSTPIVRGICAGDGKMWTQDVVGVVGRGRILSLQIIQGTDVLRGPET
jgi:hypothetical protein